MSTHSGEKHFRCDQCYYSCIQATNLKRHMRQHRGEKPFACDQCSFSCRQSSHLNVHRLTHTGEKPFACKKCDYFCKRPSLLRNHMKKHATDAGAWARMEPKDMFWSGCLLGPKPLLLASWIWHCQRRAHCIVLDYSFNKHILQIFHVWRIDRMIKHGEK